MFIECRADEEAIKQRLIARRDNANEASDATWAVYRRMLDEFSPFSDPPERGHIIIDTERRLLADLAAVEEAL
jgi:predicted kinase